MTGAYKRPRWPRPSIIVQGVSFSKFPPDLFWKKSPTTVHTTGWLECSTGTGRRESWTKLFLRVERVFLNSVPPPRLPDDWQRKGSPGRNTCAWKRGVYSWKTLARRRTHWSLWFASHDVTRLLLNSFSLNNLKLHKKGKWCCFDLPPIAIANINIEQWSRKIYYKNWTI